MGIKKMPYRNIAIDVELAKKPCPVVLNVGYSLEKEDYSLICIGVDSRHTLDSGDTIYFKIGDKLKYSSNPYERQGEKMLFWPLTRLNFRSVLDEGIKEITFKKRGEWITWTVDIPAKTICKAFLKARVKKDEIFRDMLSIEDI